MVLEKIMISSMYTTINVEHGLKMSFMAFRNSEEAFSNPKGITFYSWRPNGTINAVL